MSKALALIDGDVAAYIACPSRYTPVSTLVTLDEPDIEIYAFDGKDKVFTEEEDAKYFDAAWGHFKHLIRSVQEATFSDDSLIAVKHEYNFRDVLYPDYKANRKSNKTSYTAKFVPMIRQRAVDEGIAVSSIGREADDMLRIWATECERVGNEYTICSNDKDLKCIPGKYYHLVKNELYIISEEEAHRQFYEQLLQGDSTDNVPGIVGVGEKKAKAWLANCHTEEEFRAAVIDAYKKVYEDEWHDYLLSNGKMLYLQKHPDDYFRVDEWLQEPNSIS
jgi:5'-3' exonuclease